MPIYQYRCAQCGKVHEEYRSVANRAQAPLCCDIPTVRYYSGRHHIIADIEPYKTVAADKETGKQVYIRSRKEHREFLKRNNYEEAGNELPSFMRH